MALPLSTAKATKNMPAGKGTYGSKRGRPAKKKTAPAKSKKGLPPALAKKAAEMKAKGKKKAPAKGAKKMPAFLKKKSAKK